MMNKDIRKQIKANPKPAKKKCRASKAAEATTKVATETEEQGERLANLFVEELQARYFEKVGRPTRSTNAGYLK